MPHIAGKVPLWGTVLGVILSPPTSYTSSVQYPTDFTPTIQVKSLPDCTEFPSLTPVPFSWLVRPSSLWPVLLSSQFWACVSPHRLTHEHVCPSWTWSAISGLV